MTPELLCYLAASLVALQIVVVFLRKEQRDELPYLMLLVADLGLLAFVRISGGYETLLAFIAAAAAGVLTLIPPILERFERRAVAEERFGRAAKFASVREILTPGRGPSRRRRALSALHQAALSGATVALEALEKELVATKDARTREELRGQAASLLLYEHRFAEAIAYVGAHLRDEAVIKQPALAANLIRAHAAVDDFQRALAMLFLLEASRTARDPLGSAIIQQSRLALLSSAGRVDDLAAALGVAANGVIPSDAAKFWIETARARALSPRTFDEEVSASLDRVARDARGFVSRAEAVVRRRTPLTQVLVVANVVAYFSGKMLDSAGDDTWILRAGALFRPFVLSGEWWRTISAMFLHAGTLHLVINMYGLYLLGRFTESLFGTRRFFAIYMGGGIAGALVSTYFGGGVVSVGASGAILGLLGALIVLLLARRGVWPEAWRRTLLTNLVVLGGLQIAIGFSVSMIDNAAHVGGMLGGALLAFLLPVPGEPSAEGLVSRVWSSLVAGAMAVLLTLATYHVATTPLASSLLRVPTRRFVLAGGSVEAPAYWLTNETRDLIGDPYLELKLRLVNEGGQVHLESPDLADPRYAPVMAQVIATFRPATDGDL